MVYKIEEIEGIGPTYATKLASADVKTTDDLLKLCCDAKGRQNVSAQTGVSEKQLLDWTNKDDLMRINGIGSEYSDLLEASGVDTVKELRTRNAANLAAKMKEVNEQRRLARLVPSEKTVTGWIEEAATLEPIVTH